MIKLRRKGEREATPAPKPHEPTSRPVTGAEAVAEKVAEATGEHPVTKGSDPDHKAEAEAAQPAAAAPAAEIAAQPTPQERSRERIERLERRLAIRSYAGGAGLVLALAAGIVGVVLGVSAKDESATKAEVRALRDQVETVQRESAQAAEQDVASLSERLDGIESRLSTLGADQRTSSSEISVLEDDIDDLRSQISSLERRPAGGN